MEIKPTILQTNQMDEELENIITYLKDYDEKKSKLDWPVGYIEFSNDRFFKPGYFLLDANMLKKHKIYINYGNDSTLCNLRSISGIRPVLKYSQIKEYCKDLKPINGPELRLKYGIKVVSFGTYPLEQLHIMPPVDFFIKTGKKYIIPNPLGDDIELIEMKSKNHQIKLIALDSHNAYWVKPLNWLVSEKYDIAVSQEIVAYMRFSYKKIKSPILPEITSFDESIPYQWLQNEFIPNLIPESLKKQQSVLEIPKKE